MSHFSRWYPLSVLAAFTRERDCGWIRLLARDDGGAYGATLERWLRDRGEHALADEIRAYGDAYAARRIARDLIARGLDAQDRRDLCDLDAQEDY